MERNQKLDDVAACVDVVLDVMVAIGQLPLKDAVEITGSRHATAVARDEKMLKKARPR